MSFGTQDNDKILSNVTLKVSEKLVNVTCYYCRKVNVVFETVSDKPYLVPCKYCGRLINIADIITKTLR